MHAPSSNWTEVMVNGVRYLKTNQIGRGGSSKVFRVVAPDGEVHACGWGGRDMDGKAAPHIYFFAACGVMRCALVLEIVRPTGLVVVVAAVVVSLSMKV